MRHDIVDSRYLGSLLTWCLSAYPWNLHSGEFREGSGMQELFCQNRTLRTIKMCAPSLILMQTDVTVLLRAAELLHLYLLRALVISFFVDQEYYFKNMIKHGV